MSNEEILPRELTNPVPRRGKWTAEEERYTEKIIFDFEHGTLDVPEGTTLRTLLSKVLNCDPMRITKKYTGNSSIGKRTFVPLVRTPENAIFIDMSQQDLRELRSVWINKLLLMEQWNNRKMTLMKAHMGMGSMYDPTNNTIGGVGLGGGGGGGHLSHNSASAHSSAAATHGDDNGTGAPAVKPEHDPSHPSSTAIPGGATAANGGYSNGGQFQEVTLRMILEPYVTSAMEMDYLIKWLKTLYYVLVDRTISTTDLEHSLFVGSISLPALLAIHRSRCVEGNYRLHQVHVAIDAYLKQLGVGLSPRAAGPSAPTKTTTTTATTENSSSSAPRTEDAVNGKAGERGQEGTTQSSGESKEGASADSAAKGDAAGQASASTTPPSGAEANLSNANAKPDPAAADAISVPEIESTIRNQSVFSQLPDHLKAYLTEVNRAKEMPKFPSSALGLPVSSSFGSLNALDYGSLVRAGDVLLPFDGTPGAEARYYAELQARKFAQQQARALETAQAQAKALAESYRYPQPKRDVTSAGLNEGATGKDGKETGVPAEEAARLSEEDADREDHLMQYHLALVQSLAAERNAKKNAAAAAAAQLTRQPSLLRGKSGSRVSSGAPQSQQAQKRRKMSEYADMYMAAMGQQQALGDAAHAPSIAAGTVPAINSNVPGQGASYPTYEQQFREHQQRMAAEDAAVQPATTMRPAGTLPLPPHQRQLLASLREFYPPHLTNNVGAVPPGAITISTLTSNGKGEANNANPADGSPSTTPTGDSAGNSSSGSPHSTGAAASDSSIVDASSAAATTGTVGAAGATSAPKAAPAGPTTTSVPPLPAAPAAGPPFPKGAAALSPQDAYAHHLQQLYAGLPYGLPGSAYRNTPGGGGLLGLQAPAGVGAALPAGLQGLSHAQIQQYLAGLPGAALSPDLLSAYGTADVYGLNPAGDAGSVGGANNPKLSLDEWLRSMQQQQRGAGAGAGGALAGARGYPARLGGLPAFPAAAPYANLYGADPNHLLMLSALSAQQQGRFPGPHNAYLDAAALYNPQMGFNPYLHPPRAPSSQQPPRSAAAGRNALAGTYPPSADMMGYTALLNATRTHSMPAASATAPAAAGPSAVGTTASAAASATQSADSSSNKEDTDGTAGGHSAAAEALMRLLNN